MEQKRFSRLTHPSILLVLSLLSACGVAAGQEQGNPLPQGSAIPGISIPTVGAGQGYLEVGGGHSSLTQGNPSWTDAYLRGAMAVSESNVLHTEITRQDRYGEAGWYFSAGLTHVFSPNWYADGYLGVSSRCFFLPKYRTDAYIHRKLLPRKQLILTVGGGNDKYKDIHSDYRLNTEADYYLGSSWILQSGITWTQGNPGGTTVHTQYFAVTQGQNKRHFIVLRGEYGREAYELIGPATALVNFPIHDVSATWRQWVAPHWGFNISVERYNEPIFNRTGATVGFFLDF
jgi:YaiO family outer membrane protein